jgi:hypothetical protein
MVKRAFILGAAGFYQSFMTLFPKNAFFEVKATK